MRTPYQTEPHGDCLWMLSEGREWRRCRLLDVTELSEYIQGGKGTEGYHSGTNRNCVCPSLGRTAGKEGILKSDHVRFSWFFQMTRYVCYHFLILGLHTTRALMDLLLCLCGHCIVPSITFISRKKIIYTYCIDLLAVCYKMV